MYDYTFKSFMSYNYIVYYFVCTILWLFYMVYGWLSMLLWLFITIPSHIFSFVFNIFSLANSLLLSISFLYVSVFIFFLIFLPSSSISCPFFNRLYAVIRSTYVSYNVYGTIFNFLFSGICKEYMYVIYLYISFQLCLFFNYSKSPGC